MFAALGFDNFLGGQLVGIVVENIVGGIHGLALSLDQAFRQAGDSHAHSSPAGLLPNLQNARGLPRDPLVKSTKVLSRQNGCPPSRAGGGPGSLEPKGGHMTPHSTKSALCHAFAQITLAAAVLLSLPATSFAGQGAVPGSEAAGRIVRKSCGILPQTVVVQSGTPQSTTSTSFVNVIGSGVSFT
jgi:hypothetical protein